jgi:endonuclease/exonuclease/phosphatase family metal-dependent hydrolase
VTVDKQLVIASVNWLNGGLGPDGGKDRWYAMTDFLGSQSPDVVLCQEIRGGKPGQAEEHLLATARRLGMAPVALGPSAPGAASGDGNRTAILVRERVGLTVLDRGPAGHAPWDALPWCDALLEIPGVPIPVRFYSVHLPHSSGVWQLDFASRLATWVEERREVGEAAIAGGDWNCLAPADRYMPDQLAAMPARVRPARMRSGPHGLEANYDVHYVLAAVGLEDAAAFLARDQRQPPDLTPSGAAGGRVDRVLLTRGLAPAISSYKQIRTGASDHDSLVVTIDVARAAHAASPGSADAPARRASAR